MTLRKYASKIKGKLDAHKNQVCFIIVSAFLCATVAALIEYILFNKILPHGDRFYFAWNRFISIAVMAMVAVLLVRFRQYFLNNLEKAFLVISIPMGMLFILVLPRTVYVSQDDQIHLQRAVTLLSSSDVPWSKAFRTLELMSTDVDGLNFSEIDKLYSDLDTIHEESKDQKANFGNNSLSFSRLLYLPYFIGFKISSFLRLNFTSMIAVAKLCNFLCYTIILYFAIKISSYAKKIFFVLALFLSNIFYASQFSSDPTITASLMLAIALFLRMLEMQYIPPRYIIIFALAVTWASLPKAIYCPILLLLLLIPSQKFGDRKRAIACKATMCSLMVLLAATFVLPMLSGGMTGDFRGGDTSVSQQIIHIIQHPLHFITTFSKFTIRNLPGLIMSQPTSVGIYLPLRYTQYVLSFINLMYMVLLGYVIFTSRKSAKIYTGWMRMAILAMYLIVVYSAIGALYLSFTPVGAGTVEGFQDRYLLPVLPLALVLLVPTTKVANKKREEKLYFAIIAVPFLSLAIFLSCFILRTSIM